MLSLEGGAQSALVLFTFVQLLVVASMETPAAPTVHGAVLRNSPRTT